MKTQLRFALSLLVAFASARLAVLAVEPQLPVALAESSLAGLQVSLTTSGYKFLLAEPESPGAATATSPKPARESFVASALLANRSNTDINFTFPTAAAAQVKWTFRIFDSAGVQRWQSDADLVSPQLLTDAKLDKRGRWKRLIQVPLRIDDKLLDPGIYTLEASIDADKSLGATALFEVALPPVIPEPDKSTGIKGTVLLPGEGDNPAGGAFVNIIEIRTNALPLRRPLFVWTGQADAAGKFQVVTPGGRFRVTASPGISVVPNVLGFVPPSSPLPKSVEVTVIAGAFSEATIRLGAVQPPVKDTGIKGLVLYGPISPVAVIGEPNDKPLAGALVRVEEIRDPALASPRAPFVWIGLTNNEGRFEVVTPAGKFKVTATMQPIIQPRPTAGIAIEPRLIFPSSATAEVTVEQGKFSEVTLHIDSGIR